MNCHHEGCNAEATHVMELVDYSYCEFHYNKVMKNFVKFIALALEYPKCSNCGGEVEDDPYNEDEMQCLICGKRYSDLEELDWGELKEFIYGNE